MSHIINFIIIKIFLIHAFFTITPESKRKDKIKVVHPILGEQHKSFVIRFVGCHRVV